jgi:hypothetical protein
MATARASPYRRLSVENDGLTLVEICPPLRVLHPKPAASASTTTVSSPARAVCTAACRPVYPDPMISTSAVAGGFAMSSGCRGLASHQ